MSVRDLYHNHNQCKNALVKDGWTITDDPLHLKWNRKNLYVDLGAEKIFMAEKDKQKIAVEIKTFGGISKITELQKNIGQYLFYRSIMERKKPNIKLYLAIHESLLLMYSMTHLEKCYNKTTKFTTVHFF